MPISREELLRFRGHMIAEEAQRFKSLSPASIIMLATSIDRTARFSDPLDPSADVAEAMERVIARLAMIGLLELISRNELEKAEAQN